MSRKPIYKRLKNGAIYAGALLAVRLVTVLPRRIGLSLFGSLGAFSFLFTVKERKRTVRHLEMVYGKEWSPGQIHKTAKDVYRGLGKNLFDMVYLPRLNLSEFDNIVKCDPLDEFKKAFDKGKGVVALTAHVGCFELLLHFFPIHGYKSFAIGRKAFHAGLEKLIRQNRSGEDVEYIDRSEGALKAVRLLRGGRVFGILIDQDTRVEGVFAPFLGKPAFTPSGPVKLAMKFGIPAFVITTVRRADNTHHVYISKELEFVNTGDFESDLVKNVEMANNLICEKIRQFPSQWVWMHRRWKHRPPEERAREKTQV